MADRGRFWFRASRKGDAHALAMEFAISQAAFVRPGQLSVHPATMGGGHWGMVELACPDEARLAVLLRPDLIAYTRLDSARGFARDYYLAVPEREDEVRAKAVEMIRALNPAQTLTSFMIWPGPQGWTVVLTVTASDHDAVRLLYARVQNGHGGHFAEQQEVRW